MHCLIFKLKTFLEPQVLTFKTKQPTNQPFCLAKVWQFWAESGLVISELSLEGKAGIEHSSLRLPSTQLILFPFCYTFTNQTLKYYPIWKVFESFWKSTALSEKTQLSATLGLNCIIRSHKLQIYF